ncbi:cation:proton antiporter [Fodinicola feengrottensis]|uniref:Cation:proton antiporter n=1 Tax=Fodinicola feengrottensis TaxID=435914 RepID=A0ABP4UUK8_9ACTN
MSDVMPFGVLVGLVAAAMLLAVLSNRLSTRLRVPAPALFLLAAAVASDVVPQLRVVPIETVQRIVTVALAVILFDGGMHIGRRRLRSAAGAIVWIGTAGTLVTAAAVAVLAHFLFGLDWVPALLIGTALAPTDPAVVFSVLGRREVSGRSGVILEGESGANDPVGIALMVALLAASGASGLGAVWTGVGEFALQMVVGAAVGIAGGFGLSLFIRRVPLPSEGLYALRTLASVFVIYGVATFAHGSGFLAVFVAGIILGDVRAPYKREIERFHGSLASLGEIVAFTVLGLTVSLRSLPDGHAWQIGLVLAVLLAFLVRPLLVGILLLPVKLHWGERIFVLWSGLKGAVPILLGTFVLASGLPGATQIYDIIFVVVAFSVIVQGGLVPFLAHKAGVPMRLVEPEPWSLGVRLREEPDGVTRFFVKAGSAADGTAIQDLDLGEDVWISIVVRDGRLLPVRSDTTLEAGDEVLAVVDPASSGESTHVFTGVDKE